MAAYTLRNNSVDNVPIMGVDEAGDIVSIPTSFTPVIKNSNPLALRAIVGVAPVGGPALVMNALTTLAKGIVVEVDVGALAPYILIVEIVMDLSPVQITLDIEHATHTHQSIPTR